MRYEVEEYNAVEGGSFLWGSDWTEYDTLEEARKEAFDYDINRVQSNMKRDDVVEIIINYIDGDETTADETILTVYADYVVDTYHESLIKEYQRNAAGSSSISIYDSIDDLVEVNSENADDPEATREYLEKELSYLAEYGHVYEINSNGVPRYYDDAKEAYENI